MRKGGGQHGFEKMNEVLRELTPEGTGMSTTGRTPHAEKKRSGSGRRGVAAGERFAFELNKAGVWGRGRSKAAFGGTCQERFRKVTGGDPLVTWGTPKGKSDFWAPDVRKLREIRRKRSVYGFLRKPPLGETEEQPGGTAGKPLTRRGDESKVLIEGESKIRFLRTSPSGTLSRIPTGQNQNENPPTSLSIGSRGRQGER